MHNHPQILNFPTAAAAAAAAAPEMDLYRYFSSAADDGVLGGMMMNNYSGGNYNNNNNNYNRSISSCSSFYEHASGLMMTDAAPPVAAESKAVAASRVLHKEAEKRRRERINSHLDRLRSLLPCTTKTDKATLLSKVVQRVLELKRQTSELVNLDDTFTTIPSENDEFSVYIHDNDNENNNIDNDNDNDNEDCDIDGDGGGSSKFVVLRASLCCEDRPELFTELNQVLSSLNLKTVRAEISTLGGRIHGVLVVSGESSNNDECAVFLRDALKGIVQRSSGGGSDERLKRRRKVFDSSC